jgi:SAM-dependent methyltransferase
MATTVFPGRFSLVYLVYNTISNLLTQAEQVTCFRNAARHLAPGGRFLVELWVPELPKATLGPQAVIYRSEPGYISLDTIDVVSQRVVSHHFKFGEDRQSTLFRSPHRYIWPASWTLWRSWPGSGLKAGLRIGSARLSTAESRSHVSVYRLMEE